MSDGRHDQPSIDDRDFDGNLQERPRGGGAWPDPSKVDMRAAGHQAEVEELHAAKYPDGCGDGWQRGNCEACERRIDGSTLYYFGPSVSPATTEWRENPAHLCWGWGHPMRGRAVAACGFNLEKPTAHATEPQTVAEHVCDNCLRILGAKIAADVARAEAKRDRDRYRFEAMQDDAEIYGNGDFGIGPGGGGNY